MSQSQAQPLASSKIASSQNTVVLPNLSYPSRSYSDISWSTNSRSLDKRFSRDVDLRSPPTLAFSYASATATASNTVTTSKDGTDQCPVTHALRGMRGLFWQELLIFAGDLKLLVKKLIGPAAP